MHEELELDERWLPCVWHHEHTISTGGSGGAGYGLGVINRAFVQHSEHGNRIVLGSIADPVGSGVSRAPSNVVFNKDCLPPSSLGVTRYIDKKISRSKSRHNARDTSPSSMLSIRYCDLYLFLSLSFHLLASCMRIWYESTAHGSSGNGHDGKRASCARESIGEGGV